MDSGLNSETAPSAVTPAGIAAIVWGVGGVVLLLAGAIYRLAPVALETFESELLWYHWGALAGNLLFMGVFEGYAGFQKAFAPRVAVRAAYAAKNPSAGRLLGGPLFCMCYFQATRKRMIVSYALTSGIIALIVGVKYLPQPWRGIVDAGVILGLSWGLIAIIVFTVRAFSGRGLAYPSDVPEA